MNAAESENVVPTVFARPAGLTGIASPLSTDVTDAPARDVVIAPGPGKYMPPAKALLIENVAIAKIATHRFIAETLHQREWSDVQLVGAFLGPYRNLTTLTASVLALHPHVQVLNHAGRRLLAQPEIDFVTDPNKWDRFRETALAESRGGGPGLHGGSITHSHAFEVPAIRAAYRKRFGKALMRRRVDTLVWKDSLVLSRAIRRSGSIEQLLDRCDGLRFLLPIRHPIDCAVSCVLYGHGPLFTKDVSVVGVLDGVLRELAWARSVQQASPRRVLMFWEYEFGVGVLQRLSKFLDLADDRRWLADATRCFVVAKQYEHPPGLVARYEAKVRDIFANDRAFAAKLMRFVA